MPVIIIKMIELFKIISFVQYREKSINEMYIASPQCSRDLVIRRFTGFWKSLMGAVSIWRCRFTSTGFPIMRRSHDRIISIMGVPKPGKSIFILKQGLGLYWMEPALLYEMYCWCTFVIVFNAVWKGLRMNSLTSRAMGYVPVIGNYDGNSLHYDDVIMGAIASLITSLTIVYSNFYSDADQRKHHSSASLAFVWGIHRRPVNSPHK